MVEAAANHHAPARVSQCPGIDALTAVYVANIVAHEQVASHGGMDDPFTPMDEGYLKALGIHERLSAWREIAVSQTGSSRPAYWEIDKDSKAA